MMQSWAAPSSASAPVELPKHIAGPWTPSRWIWIPWAWLFLASTRSLSLWLSLGAIDVTATDTDLSGSPVDRAVLILLLVLGLFVLAGRAKRTKAVLRRNKCLVALFVYMALSIMWSNFPAISLRRCVRSMGTLVMVLVVLTEEDPLDALRSMLRRLFLVHIPLSVATIKYFRNIGVAYTWDGIQEMWVGLTRHKNNLGQVAMCSGLLFTWQVLQNWARKKLTLDLLLLALSLWLLRGSDSSHSSAGIVGFVVGAACLLGLQFAKQRAAHVKRIILGITVALLLSTPFAYFVFDTLNTTPVNVVLEASGRDETLSDRTFLWKDLLNIAAQNPVLGVGCGAFWVGPIGYTLYPLPNWSKVTHTWRPGEGHNGYIDVYVNLGAIGVALVLIVIAFAIAGALDNLETQFELGRLRMTLLLSILINNLAESSLLDGTHSLWFLFLLVAVNIPAASQRVGRRLGAA